MTAAVDLPDVVITDDGNAFTTEVAEPCWLYAWRTTELADDGVSWLSVYRSAGVRDTDPMYQPVLDLVGDAELVATESVADPGMMFGAAELSLYGARR